MHFPFHHTKDAYNTLRYSGPESLVILAELNSFVLDYVLRARMTTNLNLFYLYQLPVPRLTEKDPAFAPIVSRAAKLICTTPEFDDLAREVGLASHTNGATDTAARAQLRAELDGLVAHLYGLTEEEFAYILTTFPLVDQPVKDAVLEAFRTLAPKPSDPEIAALLAAGENAKVEFKSSARWDLRENKKNPVMEQVILKTVAAFLNSDGGTLLLGVSDDGSVLGLEHDYQTLKKQNADGYELFLGELVVDPLRQRSQSFPQILLPRSIREADLQDRHRSRAARGLGERRERTNISTSVAATQRADLPRKKQSNTARHAGRHENASRIVNRPAFGQHR